MDQALERWGGKTKGITQKREFRKHKILLDFGHTSCLATHGHRSNDGGIEEIISIHSVAF